MMDDLTYTINYCEDCGEAFKKGPTKCYCDMELEHFLDWDDYEVEEYSEICRMCRQTEDFCDCFRFIESI